MDSNWLEAVLQRKDHLCRTPPHCPKCGTEQVQLKSYDFPARWKCRKCFVYFSHEPPVRERGLTT